MKTVRTTVQVRIEVEQEEKLQKVANVVPGATVNGLIRRAIDLFLEIEGPVYMETYQQTRMKLINCRERQPVITDIHVKQAL